MKTRSSQKLIDSLEENDMPRRSQRLQDKICKFAKTTIKSEIKVKKSNDLNQSRLKTSDSPRLSNKSKQTPIVPKKTQTIKQKSKVNKLQNNQTKPKVTKKELTSKVTKKIPKPIKKNNQHDVNGNHTTSKKTSSSKIKNLRKISESDECFKKYGIVVPSVDEIRNNMKETRAKIEKMKNLYNEMKERFADSDESITDVVEKTTVELTVLLDCKHLNQEQLDEYFNGNLQYLKDIVEGVVHSSRHEKFIQNLNVSCFSYAPEMCMFSSNQVQHLATMLEENITIGNKDSSYFFKVLLPEICLKIFMDVHYKTMEEAKAYIEWRPID